jgi:hypothetical protein
MYRSTLALAVILLAGCVQTSQDDAANHQVDFEHTASASLTEGTPQAVGVLNLLNDKQTTFSVLDDDVALRSTAARTLISHRDGADGLLGTSDDNLYESVREVDAQKYVGPVSLTLLGQWAQRHGYEPQGDDYLGTWDSVDFTVREADRVLHRANTMSKTELDVDLGLDIRGVNSILDARPIVSVPVLAGLYYVGSAQLGRLRDWTAGGAAGAECHRGAQECGEFLTCYGFGPDHDLGRCVNFAGYVRNAGRRCDPLHACAPGLVCAGITLGWGAGRCSPPWQADTFSSNHAFHVPDDARLSAASPLRVFGQASIPLDIVVGVDVEHERPSDLVLFLEEPDGNLIEVWGQGAGVNGTSSSIVRRGASRTQANGVWTLHAFDEVDGSAGIIRGWSLYLTSTFR